LNDQIRSQGAIKRCYRGADQAAHRLPGPFTIPTPNDIPVFPVQIKLLERKDLVTHPNWN
jgi:hypothetical protein